MATQPKDGIVLKDFPGLANTDDRRDLPPGAAAVQKNLLSRIKGEMSVRRGLLPVKFTATS